MKIHADLSERAVVDSATLEWVSSPMAGVERRMLERDGDEVARATSLVRYAPGSAFAAHSHELGEEFLVLDGVFSDESGDYPKGMYVRNPPGSRHTPSSEPGAVILVKLRQMQPDDDAFVRVNTLDPSGWQNGRSGEHILPLLIRADEEVVMLDWEHGASFGEQEFPGGAEYFVVEGSFKDQDGTYDQGTWLRLPAASRQVITTRHGARVWRKTGHL
ncbi:cupin domain-containing protein [Roseibium salinum]|uniref:Cupin domain-containing protein n=1 Tax=Roseibium salinum TaxID=1604349 RepID=A0ABT3R3F8_9HYPH|nr:cupin domain-containing protein [Roseibium sp. DSM 29163]MCX2723517.1 cupin domain-containing protein [Roseibium sp. DSM 29163]MDN3718613.1 cupin domain-containing protein [Roseibium salinum]